MTGRIARTSLILATIAALLGGITVAADVGQPDAGLSVAAAPALPAEVQEFSVPNHEPPAPSESADPPPSDSEESRPVALETWDEPAPVVPELEESPAVPAAPAPLPSTDSAPAPAPPPPADEPELDHVPVAEETPITPWVSPTDAPEPPAPTPATPIDLSLEPLPPEPTQPHAAEGMGLAILPGTGAPQLGAGAAAAGNGYDSGAGCAAECIVSGVAVPLSYTSAELTITTSTDARISVHMDGVFHDNGDGLVREARIVLEGLEPGRTYYPTAVAVDAQGRQAQSSGWFEMPPEPLRMASVTFLAIDVINDGDHDPGPLAVNRGEISFKFYVDGEHVGDMPEKKIKSGSRVELSRNLDLSRGLAPGAATVLLRVQGSEYDFGQGGISGLDGGTAQLAVDMEHIADLAAGSQGTPGVYEATVVLDTGPNHLQFKVYVGINVWYE